MADNAREVAEIVSEVADLLEQAGDRFRPDWLRLRISKIELDDDALNELGGIYVYGGMGSIMDMGWQEEPVPKGYLSLSVITRVHMLLLRLIHALDSLGVRVYNHDFNLRILTREMLDDASPHE